MVYTGAAGIDQLRFTTSYRAGTNRRSLRNNQITRNRHERVRGDRYYDFIDKFVNTARKLFPKLSALGGLQAFKCRKYSQIS